MLYVTNLLVFLYFHNFKGSETSLKNKKINIGFNGYKQICWCGMVFSSPQIKVRYQYILDLVATGRLTHG